MYKENIKDMDSFIERFCAKYYFPYAEGRQLIEGMEYKTYRKGDCLVREGERDTSFYIIARGIWRGHYLRDGQEVSVSGLLLKEKLYFLHGDMSIMLFRE